MNRSCASILDLSGEDSVELLLRDKSITIDIGSLDELIDLLLGDAFAKLGSDLLEVTCGDEAGSLTIKQSEDLANIGAGVFVVNALCHQGKPLSEVNGATAIGIKIGDHLEDDLTLGLESEGGHGGLEL